MDDIQVEIEAKTEYIINLNGNIYGGCRLVEIWNGMGEFEIPYYGGTRTIIIDGVIEENDNIFSWLKSLLDGKETELKVVKISTDLLEHIPPDPHREEHEIQYTSRP